MQIEADLTALKVSIGFPCGPHIPYQTMASFNRLMLICGMQKIDVQVDMVACSSDVVVARDEVLASFLKSDCDRLFWIDSDIVFGTNDFFRLLTLSTKMEVVCATYPMKNPRCAFTIAHPDMLNFELNDFGCIKILSAGLGFTVMHREVVERLVATKPTVLDPYHKTERPAVFRRDVTDGNRPRGEDAAFFADIRELGYDVWLDPTIQLGHVGTYAFKADPIKALKLEHIYRAGE